MTTLAHRHLISIDDLSKEELLYILEVAEKIKSHKIEYSSLMSGKILATLFYEPSTRTRLSFEVAMHRLGGEVISVVGGEMTSLKKRETLEDNIKIISSFVDIIVMRHPQAHSVAKVSPYCGCPLINAGDGANEHPTQTILDLFTIKEELGRLQGFNIGFLGDLKFSRTVKSLVYALLHFDQIKMYFISPPSLKLPEEVLSRLKAKGTFYQESEEWPSIVKELDILYITRIQEERFEKPEEYQKLKGTYVFNKETISKLKTSLKVMHPLPRVDEIHPSFDEFSGAIYFKQAQNGIWTRMAILALLNGVI